MPPRKVKPHHCMYCGTKDPGRFRDKYKSTCRRCMHLRQREAIREKEKKIEQQALIETAIRERDNPVKNYLTMLNSLTVLTLEK